MAVNKLTLAEIQAKASPELIAAQEHGAIAQVVSQGRTYVGILPRQEFGIWCASTGVRAAIQDISNNAQHPLRSSALAVLDVLGGLATGLDFSMPANVGLLDAWVMAGVITSSQKNELIAMATYPDPVSVYDVIEAMKV